MFETRQGCSFVLRRLAGTTLDSLPQTAHAPKSPSGTPIAGMEQESPLPAWCSGRVSGVSNDARPRWPHQFNSGTSLVGNPGAANIAMAPATKAPMLTKEIGTSVRQKNRNETILCYGASKKSSDRPHKPCCFRNFSQPNASASANSLIMVLRVSNAALPSRLVGSCCGVRVQLL